MTAGSEAWGGTTLVLPDSLWPLFRDALTGRELRATAAGGGSELQSADVFATLPVALLEALP